MSGIHHHDPPLVDGSTDSAGGSIETAKSARSVGCRNARVLVIAEAANPEWTSVPLVGWSLACALRRVAEVHIVTQVRNRAAFIRAGLKENHDFSAIDSELIGKPAWILSKYLPGGWTTKTAMASLVYPYFESLVWKRFRGSLMAGDWDVVHRVTPLSPTAPSPIAKKLARIPVPFVVGPLNGGVPWPREFNSARRAEREWLSYVRGVYKLLPGYRSTRRHASVIVCGSEATLEQMPAWCRHRCVYQPENAIDPDRFSAPSAQPRHGCLRAVFIGRLVPYKCCDVLLEAAAPLIRSSELQVDVIGDGPMREELVELVRSRGIEQGVRFTGWVEHSKVQEELVKSDVLGFPSIREFGGGVVLEAMALGLCPIVVGYGGPGELVDDEIGVRLPLQARPRLVESMRSALRWAVSNRAEVRDRGRRARERVFERHTWDAKARWIREIYQNLIQGS